MPQATLNEGSSRFGKSAHGLPSHLVALLIRLTGVVNFAGQTRFRTAFGVSSWIYTSFRNLLYTTGTSMLQSVTVQTRL